MKNFNTWFTENNTNFQQGMGYQKQQQINQTFEQRQYIFDMLRRYKLPGFENKQSWATPEAASQLYNKMGRSFGIVNAIKNNPEVLQKVIEGWWKAASQGNIPLF